jgi:S-ribosylhomocysteine lyase
MKTKVTEDKLPESALFDHRLVKAPFLRYAGIIDVNDQDKIYKYDLRLTQPNVEYVPMPILHALEHAMAVAIRKYIGGIVDFSPMGCQTGFYVVTINQDYDKVASALEKAFRDVLAYDEVPFANVIQCGAAKNHDLPGAKVFAQRMLDGRSNWEVGARDAMNTSADIELH